MKNTLIIQFKTKDFSDPYEFIIDLETSFFQLFSQNDWAIVDGHDIGKELMNIFIFPRRSWGPVIDRVNTYLKYKGHLNKAVVAKRIGKSGNIKVIHPEGYKDKFELI